MNKAKRMVAVLLSLLLLCMLAACDAAPSDPDDGDTALSPTEVVAAAMEKMAGVKSMDAVMEMELEMAVAGESMTVRTAMNMTTFLDPLKLRAEVTLDMGELGSMETAVYAQSEGDHCTMYLYDGSTWVAQTVALEDLTQYNAQSSMDLYMSGVVNFAEAGTEELEGGTADKYTGVIPNESLKAVLEESGALDSLDAMLGGTVDGLTDIYAELGELPVTVWLDQASGYPVRFYMDMSGVMEKVSEKLAAELIDVLGDSLEIPKMTITMTYANLDAATDFDIPAEALNAA